MNDPKQEQAFFDYVDSKQSLYIQRLSEAVAFPSVSAQLGDHYDDIVKMIQWTESHLTRLGAKCTLKPNPAATSEKALPPILLAELTVDPKFKTLGVYGHLDVQPAMKEDGWDTDPFVLVERDGKLYGRGSTDDKGPVLSWIAVVEAHQDLGIPLPVNLKFVFEGMEEYGSDGLFETIQQETSGPNKFLSNVDFFCITDNYWLGKRKPCLTYGLRGLAYFSIEVNGLKQDLHSGVYGGTVPEPMTDLIRLMSTLVDNTGKILIGGVMDSVKPITPEEEQLYETIEFDPEEYKDEIGLLGKRRLLNTADGKKSILMARWRYPTLSLHGIEKAFAGSGAKTVIPASVIGKFSLRLVPDQDPAVIETLVKAHLAREFDKLNSPHTMKVTMIHGAKAWLSSPSHPNFVAASNAIEKVHDTKPDFTREGGSIPITNAFEDYTGGMNVCLMALGACDDMAHSQNEKYNISNYLNGIKVCGLYLHELGKIKGPKPSDCKCAPLTQEELMVPGAFIKGFKCKCEM